MSTIQDLIKQMESWPVSMLVVVCLNFVGWAIQRSEFLSNKLIPLVLMMLGSTIYMSVGDLGSIHPSVRNPILVLALYGMLLGVLSWIAHNVIWRALVKRFPQLANGDSDSDTKFLKKPKDDKPPDAK